MGYLRNECIVVSGRAERVAKAHAVACSIFNNECMGSLVGGLIQHAANGGAAFLISPDGSKEGWGTSVAGDAAREAFIEWLRDDSNRELYLDWSLLLLGGDDQEYRVLASPEEQS